MDFSNGRKFEKLNAQADWYQIKLIGQRSIAKIQSFNESLQIYKIVFIAFKHQNFLHSPFPLYCCWRHEAYKIEQKKVFIFVLIKEHFSSFVRFFLLLIFLLKNKQFSFRFREKNPSTKHKQILNIILRLFIENLNLQFVNLICFF